MIGCPAGPYPEKASPAELKSGKEKWNEKPALVSCLYNGPSQVLSRDEGGYAAILRWPTADLKCLPDIYPMGDSFEETEEIRRLLEELFSYGKASEQG